MSDLEGVVQTSMQHEEVVQHDQVLEKSDGLLLYHLDSSHVSLARGIDFRSS